jgi:hypothetical protein
MLRYDGRLAVGADRKERAEDDRGFLGREFLGTNDPRKNGLAKCIFDRLDTLGVRVNYEFVNLG